MNLTLTSDTLYLEAVTVDLDQPMPSRHPDVADVVDVGDISGLLSAPISEDDEPALSSYARCSDGNGTLSFLFFSDDDLELARAKAICRTCGLQESCLSGAVERAEPYGVWGGKLVLDGVPVEFKRKRGRPSKHPKPVLVVDEAPIPPHLVA